MKFRLLGIVLAISLALPSVEASNATAPSPTEWVAEVAARQAEIDLAIAPVRSRAELQRHLRDSRDSPLNRLPPVQRQRFVDGLVFTESGLASYSYLPLEGSVGVTETYRLLALFGAQSSIGGIRGLRAVSRAEAAMLESSGASAMASMPRWRHGICVISGTARKCMPDFGSNCSRACDR